MRVGFEAKRAFKNFTGLGNYARSVIFNLSEKFPDDSFYLYSPETPKNRKTNMLFNKSNIFVRNASKNLIKFYWRSFGVTKEIKKDKIDIFHGLSHELPRGLKKNKIKSIVTIHDLIFIRYPHYFSWFDRKIYLKKIKHACKKADKIIAISEQTKRDIIDYLNVKESKIKVVYQGCDKVFINNSSELPENQLLNIPKQYLLCVATIEERKNQLIIIKALKYIPEHIHLVIVGKAKSYKSILNNYENKHHLNQRIHYLENIPSSYLPFLYKKALAFVYPSLFEGFGIPILEALNMGIPVIAAKGSCLEEAGGEHSLYFNPNDEEELAEHINLLIENPSLKEKMITEGKVYAENFSDHKIATNLMAIYKEVLCS